MNLKPDYRVPLMSEIDAMQPNGFKVISTFAGAGGSSLGYRMAGFSILMANEFVEAARDTYAANKNPATILDGHDIRNLTPGAILERVGIKAGELDVLDGSPPCANFSTAGRREQTWGKVRKYSDTEQRSDDLFFEFVRILTGIRPKVFVAENVSGLVKGTAKGYFLDILKKLTDAGYNVRCKALDAQWLGVPQARKRVIFVGTRDDLKIEPQHPDPLQYRYSVREALPHLDHAKHDTRGQFKPVTFTDAPCPTITVGDKACNARHYLVREKIIAIGGNGGFAEREVWQSPDRPNHTIGAGFNCGNNDGASGTILTEPVDRTTPPEKRKFTIPELKRICGFPDDFIVTGDYAQQWERLGRAVPPVMMSHIAATIRDKILIPLQLRDDHVRAARHIQPDGHRRFDVA